VKEEALLTEHVTDFGRETATEDEVCENGVPLDPAASGDLVGIYQALGPLNALSFLPDRLVPCEHPIASIRPRFPSLGGCRCRNCMSRPWLSSSLKDSAVLGAASAFAECWPIAPRLGAAVESLQIVPQLPFVEQEPSTARSNSGALGELAADTSGLREPCESLLGQAEAEMVIRYPLGHLLEATPTPRRVNQFRVLGYRALE
jgi:hypothetical protein